MKLAILFHFNKHTETVAINTNKISGQLKNKILKAKGSTERVSISYNEFSSIKKHQLKRIGKNLESIVGLNVVL